MVQLVAVHQFYALYDTLTVYRMDPLAQQQPHQFFFHLSCCKPVQSKLRLQLDLPYFNHLIFLKMLQTTHHCWQWRTVGNNTSSTTRISHVEQSIVVIRSIELNKQQRRKEQRRSQYQLLMKCFLSCTIHTRSTVLSVAVTTCSNITHTH